MEMAGKGKNLRVFFPEKGKRERHGRWVLLMPELVTSKWRHSVEEGCTNCQAIMTKTPSLGLGVGGHCLA